MFYIDPEDLTPEERLNKIVEILTTGVLRLCEEQNIKTTNLPENSKIENKKDKIF
ncbi:MAG: hypothetical protein PHE88_00690 [Elusimicrobia bacterium]|nr:hypothetical protein [Elusimicrobiota bacterium]